jgi:protein-tyrosine phosphatase
MYKFAAASADESFAQRWLCRIVFGAARPGYTDRQVAQWLEFMLDRDIQRVCCLLSASQLNRYSDLPSMYRQNFGLNRVCWAPIDDFRLVDRQLLLHHILPFLADADRSHEQVVIHCSGGVGRTGQVLAAWLVAGRGYSRKLAIDTVIQTGRNPYEAVIAAPFWGRNPWRVRTELHSLLDELTSYTNK